MPGCLYPADGPRCRTNHAEVAFYQTLAKRLPAECPAWHSLRLRLGRDWEGEGDFVVAAPERGLLVVEVKGEQNLTGQQKSRLITLGKLGTHRLSRADAVDASTSIVADTFLCFKGQERPFVVITELVRGPRMKYDTRMHIALTRARAGVIIVCDELALAEDPRLGRLAKV